MAAGSVTAGMAVPVRYVSETTAVVSKAGAMSGASVSVTVTVTRLAVVMLP